MGNSHRYTTFTPQFVGFETIFKEIEETLSTKTTNKYPPYNLLTDADETYFRIELAVAGFAKDQLTVSLSENTLLVEGDRGEKDPTDVRELHRGISQKKFSRNFTLAEHLEVTNVGLEHGILTIELLKKVPEDKETKHFKIT